MTKGIEVRMQEKEADDFADVVCEDINSMPDEEKFKEATGRGARVLRAFEVAEEAGADSKGMITVVMEREDAASMESYSEDRAQELVDQCFNSSGMRGASYWLAGSEAIYAALRDNKRGQ
ncbi:MAG: hypothetical protein KKA28_18745 [Planctomycetes bacterium]|nr:hypothetical protein [Planctomycetota bacterium]